MAGLTVDFRKHRGPKPADDMLVMQPNHHWLWKLPTGLQATWIMCLSTLPPDSGTLISKWNAKFTFIWKKDHFGPLSNSSVLFLFSPDKMLLTMFMFHRGSPFPEDVCAWWLLMHWLSQVHWSSPKCLNRLCLTVFSSLWPSLLLVHIFLHNFFLPVNFAFNMLWHSTHWTARSFSNDPLWLTLFGGCQWSSSGPLSSQQCSPLFWFQRTRDTHNLYCMDGHLLKLKCKYSNILRYWFLTFSNCKF